MAKQNCNFCHGFFKGIFALKPEELFHIDGTPTKHVLKALVMFDFQYWFQMFYCHIEADKLHVRLDHVEGLTLISDLVHS